MTLHLIRQSDKASDQEEKREELWRAVIGGATCGFVCENGKVTRAAPYIYQHIIGKTTEAALDAIFARFPIARIRQIEPILLPEVSRISH